MQKISKLILSSALTLILSGCVGAMPEYKSSKSSMIVFKTPTIKYADQGFVSKANSETKVEIYSSGQALMRLRITPSQTCLSSLECMSNKEFNKKVLQANYPDDTLLRVFNGEAIFGGKNLQNTANGFVQNIGTINYSVNGGNIKFIDSSNGVKIEVRN